MMKWVQTAGRIARRDVDERRKHIGVLPEVLNAHAGTIRVLHTLRPLAWRWLTRDVDP